MASVAGAAQVTLAWNASVDPSVTGYNVYYGTATGIYPSKVNAGNATTATVANLTAGQRYYFVVTAYSAIAESGYSNEVSTVVSNLPTTTVLASSTNPSVAGAAVTFTANVTGTSPTGTVAFRDGGTAIAGCAAVSLTGSGNTRAAACTTSALASGSRSIVAVYGGNATNAGSTSATLVQVVKAATATSLTSSPNPAIVGTTVTLTATVNGSAPTGTVEFRDGGVPIPGCSSVALTGTGNVRSASCATSGLPQGTRSLAAYYGGNATNMGSASAFLSQVMQAGTGPAATFADVPVGHFAFAAVEAVAYNSISLGCSSSPRLFCPDALVNRDEMAVFLERAMRGITYAYAPTGTRFADVPLSHWAAGPIEQLHLDGVTGGCALSPLRFCPDDVVSRAAMAKFLLKAHFGAAYSPPPATGTVFVDVPASHSAAAWIEEFYRLGYTSGCKASPRSFCPDGTVSRAAMAVFLQRVFELAGPPP